MHLTFEKETALSTEINKITPTELKQTYYRTFSSKDGKIILEDLANMSGMYRTNFVQTGGIDNSHYIAFLEGHRALFLYICSQLDEKIENIEGKI